LNGTDQSVSCLYSRSAQCGRTKSKADKATAETRYDAGQKLPHDIVGGGPLKYEQLSDNRFELYLVGWNAGDDRGIPGKTITEGDWVW
jgi:hypothetical protein